MASGTMLPMFKKKSVNIGIVVIALVIAGVGITSISSDQGNKEWREVRDDVLPQLMPATQKNALDIIWKPLADDVAIGYVLSVGSKYEFIDPNMMAKWNVTEQMLIEQAMRNLETRSRNINVEVAEATENDPTTKYVIVELDDGFAAARLLSPGVRKAISRELGNEYIAAIPTRDFLIFWHKEFPLFDAFAKQVEVEYKADAEYPLTPRPFHVSRNGIEQMVRNENFKG